MRIEEKTSKLGKCADKKLRLKDQRSDHVGTITSLTKPSFQCDRTVIRSIQALNPFPKHKIRLFLPVEAEGKKKNEWLSFGIEKIDRVWWRANSCKSRSRWSACDLSERSKNLLPSYLTSYFNVVFQNSYLFSFRSFTYRYLSIQFIIDTVPYHIHLHTF